MNIEPRQWSQAQQPVDAAIRSAIKSACRSVAPAWPLDRQIAVNPYWGFVDQSFEAAAATLRRLVGARFTLAAGDYLAAWRAGEISADALARALAESGMPTSVAAAVDALRAPLASVHGLPLLSDVVDQLGDAQAGPGWRETITQQVSQYCASYFDEQQSDWHRVRKDGLYARWRAVLRVDHALEPLMHAPQLRRRARELPASPDAAIAWALDRLGMPDDATEDLLRTCLLRIQGWASWCAYLAWQASLAGRNDPNLRELLAIRCCWEALLHGGHGDASPAASAWRAQWAQARRAAPFADDALAMAWQRAHELSYQDKLVALLERSPEEAVTAAATATSGARPAAQLVFCIDVRSERLRRALEAADAAIETKGFAGFFGLPIELRPIGTPVARPRLPGLLAPSLVASEGTGSREIDDAIARYRSARLQSAGAWESSLRSPTGAFAHVEAFGLGYAGAILRRMLGSEAAPADSLGLRRSELRALRPRLALEGEDVAARQAALVARVLRAMGLTTNFARLLVLVGHGSQSANNPQAAALDCGACGGHSGEANARVLAGLVNDAGVRAALRGHGIEIPQDTVAVAALHNTTTDEVTWPDAADVPASHAAGLRRLQQQLVEAGHAVRAERCTQLGLAYLAAQPDALLKSLRRRARDWAETRPEWGLANNAALVVGPRARTHGLDLQGRCFLHDYDPGHDEDGTVLELIMTAPMVVAHWINMQYYASTVDPQRHGSGNKVLHNVACGGIGVFEGNTGDLRIGLARQSVHDGERCMHAPLRLSAVIDAPRERIDSVIARHPLVRQLVDNRWLYLLRFAPQGIEWRRDGRWQALAPAGQRSR